MTEGRHVMRRVRPRLRRGIGENCLRPIVTVRLCVGSRSYQYSSNYRPSYSKLSSQDKTRYKARGKSIDAELIVDRQLYRSCRERSAEIPGKVTKSKLAGQHRIKVAGDCLGQINGPR